MPLSERRIVTLKMIEGLAVGAQAEVSPAAVATQMLRSLAAQADVFVSDRQLRGFVAAHLKAGDYSFSLFFPLFFSLSLVDPLPVSPLFR